MDEPDLDIIDDPYRTCEIDDIVYHEEFGGTCDQCDIWICMNCWPEHHSETGHEIPDHVKRHVR